MMVVLAIFAIVAVASAVHAATGFGFALVALPLLTLLVDVRTAVVGMGVAGLLLSVGTARLDRAHVRWRVVAWLLVAAAVGMPFGVLLLKALPGRMLALLVAVVVLGCTAMVWRRPALRGGRAMIAAAGVLAGVLATATGTNGPPLVAIFAGLGFSPREFRASIAAYFSVTGVLSLMAYGLAGELTRPVFELGAIGLVAVPLGWLMGNTVFVRFDADRFRQAVLTMLVVTSTVVVFRVVAG